MISNPRKVWLLYAKRLYELFRRNEGEIAGLVKENLDRVADELALRLDLDRKERLLEIAMAFFHEEYVEAYRRASRGEEPDSELSAIQSSQVIEETIGYPVAELFRRMVQEIINRRTRPEEEVVETLIEKYGAYPAQAILVFDLEHAALPENHVPDFCLAQAIQSTVERYVRRRNQEVRPK